MDAFTPATIRNTSKETFDRFCDAAESGSDLIAAARDGYKSILTDIKRAYYEWRGLPDPYNDQDIDKGNFATSLQNASGKSAIYDNRNDLQVSTKFTLMGDDGQSHDFIAREIIYSGIFSDTKGVAIYEFHQASGTFRPEDHTPIFERKGISLAMFSKKEAANHYGSTNTANPSSTSSSGTPKRSIEDIMAKYKSPYECADGTTSQNRVDMFRKYMSDRHKNLTGAEDFKSLVKEGKEGFVDISKKHGGFRTTPTRSFDLVVDDHKYTYILTEQRDLNSEEKGFNTMQVDRRCDNDVREKMPGIPGLTFADFDSWSVT